MNVSEPQQYAPSEYLTLKFNLGLFEHWFFKHLGKGHLLNSLKRPLQVVNKLQQTSQFHQVTTSMSASGFLQLFLCRLFTTCSNNLQPACGWQVLESICNKSVDNLQHTCHNDYANASWYRPSCCKICQQLCRHLRIFSCVRNWSDAIPFLFNVAFSSLLLSVHLTVRNILLRTKRKQRITCNWLAMLESGSTVLSYAVSSTVSLVCYKFNQSPAKMRLIYANKLCLGEKKCVKWIQACSETVKKKRSDIRILITSTNFPIEINEQILTVKLEAPHKNKCLKYVKLFCKRSRQFLTDDIQPSQLY